MVNITYEQFEYWCKKWNYTIDEGYRAMCFVTNIIQQNLGNYTDYANKVCNDNNNHSNLFKNHVRKRQEDVIRLSILYGELNNNVFDMLKKHDEETN